MHNCISKEYYKYTANIKLLLHGYVKGLLTALGI